MKMTNSKPINQMVKGGKEVSSRCEKSEYNYMNVLSSWQQQNTVSVFILAWEPVSLSSQSDMKVLW